MSDYKHAFLEFAIETDVLRFGKFTLKSGRVSPYFFNSGLFNTGNTLAKLGQYYAQAITESGIDYDMIYGPAYKGIPLVAATSIALVEHHDRDVPYAFNRKEAKAHGEGGIIVGAKLNGKVLIIDDVISAGTSVRESVDIIRGASAEPAGVAISIDRQERGTGALSAIQEVEQNFGIKVISIATLSDLIGYMKEKVQDPDSLKRLNAYREQYGAR